VSVELNSSSHHLVLHTHLDVRNLGHALCQRSHVFTDLEGWPLLAEHIDVSSHKMFLTLTGALSETDQVVTEHTSSVVSAVSNNVVT
jgi:hypothetical protein